MVLFSHAAHQMAAKVVYYGPGLCGKTTNLNQLYQKTALNARGEMVSLNTETDRTLFFDLLPMDMGMIWGFQTMLQLYTVPGQVFYNVTRKRVLKGADGIVFVADSQRQMLDANKESLRNLELNLQELGMNLQELPLVFQWNKRDLCDLLPVEELELELNPQHRASFCSIASEAVGVFETLKGISRQTLLDIRARHFSTAGAPAVETCSPALERSVTLPRPTLLGKLTAPKPYQPKVPGTRTTERPLPPKVVLPKITCVPRPALTMKRKPA